MTAHTDPNVPLGRAVVLDHIGHFVADRRACEAALEALGFTVTPYSAQTTPDGATGRPMLTGTGNVCVMLRAGYLEFLLHTADTPIGLEFKSALARRAGVHLAAFGIADAEATHRALADRGRDMRPLVRMSRPIATADGESEARFTVARLAAGAMPEGRVQLLTHHTVDAMWQPRWLTHENGAIALDALIVSAPDPAEAAARFSTVLDRPALARGAGHVIALDRGAVKLIGEAEAEALVGAAVEPGRPAFIGYRLTFADLSAAVARLEAAGHAVRREGGSAILAFPEALGRGAFVLAEAA